MCTAVSLISKQNEVLFGRTMDFSHELNPETYIVPKDYEWQSIASNDKFTNKYKFIGSGQNIGKIIFADGMNEQGLGVAVLYFPGYAVFSEEIKINKKNIASLEVVNYLLGNCANTKEVIQTMPTLEIIGIQDEITNSIAPLHWIVSDKYGQTITVEKTANGTEIINNPIGVLANSPNFSWHLTNLNNYMNISPYQLEEINWSNFPLKPFGQGAGGLGIPGDYTSPSRFVRIAFQKNFLMLPDNKKQAPLACFELMKTVSIPKGIVMTNKNSPDYTQYTVFMNLNTGDYYFNSYLNSEIKQYNINNINPVEITSLGKIKKY